MGWVDHPQHREFWHQQIPKKNPLLAASEVEASTSTGAILVGLYMGCFRDLWPWFSSGFILVGLWFWIWVDFHFSCYQKNSWLPERCIWHLRLGFNMIDIMIMIIHSLKQSLQVRPWILGPDCHKRKRLYSNHPCLGPNYVSFREGII